MFSLETNPKEAFKITQENSICISILWRGSTVELTARLLLKEKVTFSVPYLKNRELLGPPARHVLYLKCITQCSNP